MRSETNDGNKTVLLCVLQQWISLKLNCKMKQGYTKEEVEAALKFAKIMTKFMTGQGVEAQDFDVDARDMHKLMCKEIQTQRKRLGGDFAVAHVVFSRKSRELCR